MGTPEKLSVYLGATRIGRIENAEKRMQGADRCPLNETALYQADLVSTW